MVLALGLTMVSVPAMAQVVPDETVPGAGLDLPANLQIFGKADPNIRKATAVVNDTVITGTDVDQRVALIVALNDFKLQPEDMQRLRLTVLRQLIDETLQIQAAAADKIKVTREEIDKSFDRVAASFKRSPDEMRAWLRQIGSSERSIKRQIEGELAWGRLLRARVDINVSQAEIQAILDRLTADQGTDEYHFFEIFMYATPDRANDVFAAQQRIIEQLKQGTPFEYLARVNSEATTKATGGDLGWIRLPLLPEQLQAAGKQMSAGQIAGPIEVPGGFSIIYLAEKRQVLRADPKDAKLSLKQLTITFPPGTNETQATQRAADFAKATSTMQGCGDAERVAGTIGAEVVTNDNLVVKQLPAPLQDIMLGLQVGQATQPFGSIDQGVRVLVLCGRDDPPAVGLPSAAQIEDQEIEKRTNLRAERMLRDLRRDAIIEYR
ncbi:peptidylprolyl isomerase [Sphingomonas sp. LB-2]|uniref:peptidylprolyl isomerase n=1 Tax=Sphingomonas caeni TaxID=2984949 RepID=UPI0022319DA0|nr:peptidylprolyl isomerase [Sphingomonas caeni]MCW3847750.1 peptidylprolyl isomerase [Sphingomonas caeni]